MFLAFYLIWPQLLQMGLEGALGLPQDQGQDDQRQVVLN